MLRVRGTASFRYEDEMSSSEVTPVRNLDSSPERMTAAILANMRDGVITIDRTGTITTINPQAQAVLSLDESECLGEKFGMAIFGRSEFDQLSDVVIAAIADPENVQTLEFEMPAGEQKLSLVLRTSAYRDPDSGATNGIVAIISDVTEQVNALRDRIEFGYLSVAAMLFMSVADVMGLASSAFKGDDTRVLIVNWIYVLFMLLPIFYLLNKFQRPLSDFGITTKNLKRSLLEGAAFSVPLVLICFLAGAILRYQAGEPASGWFTMHALTFANLLYIPHSFLQEFVARGFLQGSFKRFLNDQSGNAAIFVASIAFGALHSHYGIFGMAVTFLSGLVFGWIYNRQQNLAGVTLAHIAGGLAIFAVGVLKQ
jgi:PAS domain S-box-containing protein